jgi:HSP20 family protein
VSWKFYEGFSNFRREMDRLFERFFYDEMVEETFYKNWSPSIDIFESDSEILVKADLPGIKIEDIQIFLKDNILTIKCERISEKGERVENFYSIKRSSDTFVRKIKLPSTIDYGNINSHYKENILTIKIPKLKQVIKKIKVE